ncbi:DUF952 domain-containing protein [Novosphingobium sp. RD2P27]|uniref:DUF952 domain-containing protein n=1 Tax=Novosphingobium kalidii TaxID=3230299 RepID=A0ABV2CY59_9SPHN
MSAPVTVAYKVLTAEQMEQLERDGVFSGAPVDMADGYIHLSTAEQLDETVSKHFGGQENLHLAAVDLAALADSVRWEPSRGGALFPHIYGSLPLSAVIAYSELKRLPDGKIRLPVTG